MNDGRSISAKFLATDAARPRNLVRQCVYLPQPRIRSKVDSEYKNQLFLASGSNFGERQLVKRLGIEKRASWQTFRSTFTTLLTANEENVKVVQELLRHASSKTTMDVYAQARTEDKRRAQLRLVKGLRGSGTKAESRDQEKRSGKRRA